MIEQTLRRKHRLHDAALAALSAATKVQEVALHAEIELPDRDVTGDGGFSRCSTGASSAPGVALSMGLNSAATADERAAIVVPIGSNCRSDG